MPEPSSGLSLFQWTFLLACLAGLGFAGWRLTHPAQAPATTIVTHTVAGQDAGTTATLAIDAAVAPVEDLSPPASSAFSGYGRDEDGIATTFGVEVPAGQGLLVLEPGDEPMQVRIGQDIVRRLDRAPIAIALPEAIHDLAFVRGDGTSFRFARVTAGHTRYVPAP